MKKPQILILIIALLFVSGCSKYTAPNSLMSSPALKKNSGNNSNDNASSIVNNFLPMNTKLLSSDEIVKGKAVIEDDLDNDNIREIVAFFKYENNMKKGLMILKKNSDNNWTNIYERVFECDRVAEFDFMNVLSKNYKSLLIGFSLNDLTGTEYHSYSLVNDKIEDRYMGSWNKFEIINTPDVNGKDFAAAAWSEEKEYMNVDVIRYNSAGTFYDEDFYKSYFPKILEYYNNILSTGQSKQYAWYGIIKAEIKSGDAQAALSNIDKAVKIYGYDNKLKLYEAMAYSSLKKYDKAVSILDEAIKNIKDINDYSDDTLKYTMMDKKREYAYIYLEKGKVSILSGDTRNAKDSLNNAYDIFHTLDVSNYYGSNQSISIYREIDINTVNEEKAKIKN